MSNTSLMYINVLIALVDILVGFITFTLGQNAGELFLFKSLVHVSIAWFYYNK